MTKAGFKTAQPGTGARIQVALTSFVVLFTIVGLALYGLPLYYDFFVRDFAWSRTQVTSGNALSKLVVGPLFGFVAGWFVDRFGPRRLMLAGILMAGFALIGLGRMTVLWMFYLFYLLNALGYVCGGPLPNQVLLSRWFDRARGRAMGFAYLGIGVGGALVPLVSASLVAAFGWRVALQVLGLLIIVLALPFAYAVRESPSVDDHDGARRLQPSVLGVRRLQPSVLGARRLQPSDSIGAILRTPAFYLLALGSMCSIAAVGGANQHLKLYLSLDRGYSQGEAARIISLVLALSIAGRLLMGWLADRMPKKHVMLIIYLLVAVSIPLLFLASSATAMYAFAVVFGLGLGGEYLIVPLIAAELFGVGVLGRLLGVVLTADGVAEAVSPMLVGYLRDVSGSYRIGFFWLIAVALTGAAAVAALPRQRDQFLAVKEPS
ncbi:MAG: MFS transporter [Acidobacteria bacterium]|nr:MAG: MFS transporter [Acidobacteriota bacterium]